MPPKVIVLFEHPERQNPLFEALSRQNVPFEAFDLKQNAFSVDDFPADALVFNQASPSAYVCGHHGAVPLARALLAALEQRGQRVINGTRAIELELSKTAQSSLFKRLELSTPTTLAFNDLEAALRAWTTWPALLKPEQGGSGARIFEVDSPDGLRRLLAEQPELWQPDNLLLLQRRIAGRIGEGIIRMEFVGGRFLYAVRVVSFGGFNLCPSEVCHPASLSDQSGASCATCTNMMPVEFYSYPEMDLETIEEGERIFAEGGLDVGGIEFLHDAEGTRWYYDINANLNLRPSVAREFGIEPFDAVVIYLRRELSKLSERSLVSR